MEESNTSPLALNGCDDWEVVIGLEIHAQLLTNSKLFSGTTTRYGAPPNTQASLIDLGFPGVLPVVNAEAVRMAVMFGLATHCDISQHSVFARKHYFYPDLPKGYQISQYELPVVHGGYILVSCAQNEIKRIGITRAHLEEDAGKSVHENFIGMSGIDLNRAGAPLLEIVSEPDLRSPAEAIAYMRTIHTLVQYLGICDGNMQEGSFRCDANVSVRPRGETRLGTRTELKNLNSFRFVEKALIYEVERQIQLLEQGGKVIQQTRQYDPAANITRALRSKEEANDYRYFPDPDLLPLLISEALIAEIEAEMPELPWDRGERFMREYGLSSYDSGVLTAERQLADYYESVVREGSDAKLAANWVMGDVMAALNREGLSISDVRIIPPRLNLLLQRIVDGSVSGRTAKEVFEIMWNEGWDADAVIEQRGLRQVSDNASLEPLIRQVIEEFPAQRDQYRAGKTKLLGFFVGQVMQKTQGKANPQQVNALLSAFLDE